MAPVTRLALKKENKDTSDDIEQIKNDGYEHMRKTKKTNEEINKKC